MFILPFNKDNPVDRTPWFVVTLMISNGILLILTNWVLSKNSIFIDFGFVPAQPHVLTFLTSMFLHDGFWHYAGNMWFLWMFGPRVERAMGPWLFAATYLLCGLGGNVLHMSLNRTEAIPLVGASGAISGVAGIFFVLFPHNRFDLDVYLGWFRLKTFQAQTRAAVGAWIAEQTLLGFITQAVRISSIAFWAHVGGFGVGVLAGLCFVAVEGNQELKPARIYVGRLSDSKANEQEEEPFIQLKL